MANAGGATPILPPEYQQVEYIQSTGNNWIDSGINATSTLQTTVTFSLDNNFTYGNFMHLFGVFVSSNTVYSASFPSATLVRVPIRNAYDNTNYTIANVSTGTHTIIYRNGYVGVDGVQAGTVSGLYNTAYPIQIIGRSSNTTSNQTHPAGIRVYIAKLGTSTDEAAYRNLYPCYRRADNVTGMYDLINNEFIPYTGTANFITGNNV